MKCSLPSWVENDLVISGDGETIVQFYHFNEDLKTFTGLCVQCWREEDEAKILGGYLIEKFEKVNF